MEFQLMMSFDRLASKKEVIFWLFYIEKEFPRDYWIKENLIDIKILSTKINQQNHLHFHLIAIINQAQTKALWAVKRLSIDQRNKKLLHRSDDCESLHLTVIQYANQAQHQNSTRENVSLLLSSVTFQPVSLPSFTWSEKCLRKQCGELNSRNC